ncbi:MAG: hypothetical protein KIT84_33690 [Labilithrix sp.]|nr:hypothetical protein [Labilithrix sp.]MCW5816001.1 hypothetical protein [Labilithrix sp.]
MAMTSKTLALMVASLAAALATHTACREPTYVSLVISTDVACSDLQGTSITVGRLNEIEERAPLTTVTTCAADGTVGSLVVTPSGDASEEFAVRVVSGVKRNVDECKAPDYGQGCIVARRALRFVERTPLTLPIAMRAACAGVACGPEQTCVKGACVDARVDSARCEGAGCDEDTLGGGGGAGGRDGGGVVPTARGCGGLGFDFAASNVDVGTLTFPEGADDGDVLVDQSCPINGESGDLCFVRGESYAFQRVTTPAGDVAVFSMCRFRVQPAATLEVRGSLPIVIVALDVIDVQGTFSAVGSGAASIAKSKGGGQGGGEYLSGGGGGGGGFCGRGGAGGLFGGTGAPGGSPYGTPELVPLLIGSAGAAESNGYCAGGGAIQLTAGRSVTVGAGGRLNVGGDGGYYYSGGGSGGAVLLEAPAVSIAGIVAANGGGGGGGGTTNHDGAAGGPSDRPAPGGSAGTDSAGGEGSGGAGVDGAAGLHRTEGTARGGGGGGAGRVRINSRTPAEVSGVVSPSLDTPCATRGPLRSTP